MERLELSNPGLKNLSRDRFAFIPVSKILVAESGVSPDDLLVMSQPSLIPAPSPHQEHAVRFELTMTGFADRRLNQLGYACKTFGASYGNRTRAFAVA